jgi:DNA primase small subunit
MTEMELETSFAEDEDAPNTASVEAAVVSPAPASKAVTCTPELLKMYYSRLFPFSLLYDWLSYGSNTSIFSKREFSFTIEPVPDEEIYIRYQSFTTQEELAQAIVKRCPKKIDIGAVFSHSPKEKDTLQSGQLKPELRELVFDVDLTDYDGVRKCGCTGAQICRVCWGFMPMAVKVMDQALREDFGFEHIAWFYSGRRGVHAWVCDEVAKSLTDEARHAIAGYFEVSRAVIYKKLLILLLIFILILW